MFLGIDIGTTSICAVVLDANGNIVQTITESNKFAINSTNHERLQDAEGIYLACENIYKKAHQNYTVDCVGVSAQMHGVLYLDKNGQAVSPLYSWQDGRGNLHYGDSTYAKTLSEISGYNCSSGFGCTSLFYDNVNGLIPKTAVKFATIGDYVVMKLANKTAPILNQTMSASLGLFDIKKGCWDIDAIKRANLPLELFPETSTEVFLAGYTKDGVAVYTAIGDNQASVYGVVKNQNSLVVNVGTGSQISVITEKYLSACDGLELRPYFDGKYLLLGCGLCGGYSYKLLKEFFNSMFNGQEKITYADMNKWAEDGLISDAPTFTTTFKGSRLNPDQKASITELSDKNFNAQALTLSVIKGISCELKEYYQTIIKLNGERKDLVVAGNAVRTNPVLRKVIENDYGKKINLPSHKEEAAFGVALIVAERFTGTDLKNFIKYV